MVLLESLALAVALTLPAATPTAGETVLLDFTASWCGPCRTMQPIVDSLAQAGYPVRKVDIDQQKDLAARYHVTQVPSFVMVVDGKEVDRVVGVTSRGRLEQMLQRASVSRPGQGAVGAWAQSPDQSIGPPNQRLAQQSPGQLSPIQQSPDVPFHLSPAVASSHQPLPGSSYTGSSGSTGPTDVKQPAQSAVRIKVEDATGHSYGTGTIIDVRQGEALVLTCGHIFRESQGKGPISVDLFYGSTHVTLKGHLISFDPDHRDLGFVSIRTDLPLQVTKVAPAGLSVHPGQRVVSLGCDNGQAPTAKSTHVTAVGRYAGPPNIEAAGMPVEGRSGGGLLNEQGQLIGVCYSADPEYDEGLYAGIASIHAELDRLGLQDVYQQSTAPQPIALTASETDSPAMPREMPSPIELTAATAASGPSTNSPLSRGEQAALAEIRSRANGAEVVCIIRPKDPNAKSEVIVLEHVSAGFVKQLSAMRRPTRPRQLTSWQVPRSRPDMSLREVQDAAGWQGK